jgi:hypothetical protein
VSAQDPGAAIGQQPYEPGDYRKCPACAAEIGDPCLILSGFVVADGVAIGLEGGFVAVPSDRPHGSRKLRAGAVSR